MAKPTKICILYSGGLDSFIMKRLADAEYPQAEVYCVWYDIGQSYNYKEERALPSFVQKKKIEWLSENEELVAKEGSASGNIIIPGRNAVLITTAASQYLPDEIWLGALQGEIHEGSTDKNYDFLEKINTMLEYVYKPFRETPIKLKFPLASRGFGKLDAVKYAKGVLKVRAEEFTATSSCLSAEEGNCGRCVVCARRYGIFRQLNIIEQYNNYPLGSAVAKEMIGEMLKSFDPNQDCHYDSYRCAEILPAVILDFYRMDERYVKNIGWMKKEDIVYPLEAIANLNVTKD